MPRLVYNEELVHLPSAGTFDDDDIYDMEVDDYFPGRLVVKCPCCGKNHKPLTSVRTRNIESGWEWVGISHQQPYSLYVAKCTKTGGLYKFRLVTPQ